MQRRPGLRRSVLKVRVRLVGSIGLPSAVVNTCPLCCHVEPTALTLALLLLVVELQRLDAAGGKGDTALGGPRFGGQRGESAGAGALKSAADGGGARVKGVPLTRAVARRVVGDRRPLLSAAPLATAADHSARRARGA